MTHQLIAPDIFSLEIAHGLAKAQRQGKVPNSEALWLMVMADCPRLYPSLPLMRRALQIANHARIGVYDCLYVALAEREGCELITADARLLHNLQPQFPFLVDLASLP